MVSLTSACGLQVANTIDIARNVPRLEFSLRLLQFCFQQLYIRQHGLVLGRHDFVGQTFQGVAG
ncbi:hypothetical protein H8J16_28610 [Klebsiella pneumoniae]|nr:hypothetical protein [Klebsiella pneumoniae]